MTAPTAAPRFRFAVNVLPKEGILDPQGRAVEQSLPHLGLAGIGHVRVGRRVELVVAAADASAARAVVDRLAADLLCNPMIEQYAVEELAGEADSAAAAAGSPSATDLAGDAAGTSSAGGSPVAGDAPAAGGSSVGAVPGPGVGPSA